MKRGRGQGAAATETARRLPALRPHHSGERQVEPSSSGAEAEGRRPARDGSSSPTLPQRHPCAVLRSRDRAAPRRRGQSQGRSGPGRIPGLGPDEAGWLSCADPPDAGPPRRARQATDAVTRHLRDARSLGPLLASRDRRCACLAQTTRRFSPTMRSAGVDVATDALQTAAAATGERERPMAGFVNSVIGDRCNIRGETTRHVLRPHDWSSNLN